MRFLLAAALLVIASCGSADGAPDRLVDGESGTVEQRSYVIDGATVEVSSVLAELPERATVVEFTGMLIDSGGGLELCVGGVAESLPPQCDGPVVNGLDPTGWTETSTETITDVTWGSRTVVVEWPPNDDGTLTLITDSEPEPRPAPEGSIFDTPPEGCEDITNTARAEDLNGYAQNNRDRTGIVWVVDNGRIAVLQVVEEHVDDVRAELTEFVDEGQELCLDPIRYSAGELRAAQRRVEESEGYRPPLWILGAGSSGIGDTVSVPVAVADRATVEAITTLVNDPAMLSISSRATILDGE